MPRPTLRSVLAISALLAVGTAVGLTVAEIALRVTRLAPARGVHTVNQREFETLPGLFAPGQELVDWRLRELPHQVRINALGYRGEEFPREKPADEFRIIFTGDSFTYGDFVDDDETVPALLGAILAESCRAVRVVNAGVGGSTLPTHAAMIARASVLDPDLVLLMFHENDVIDLRDPLWPQLESNRRRKSEFPLNLVYGSVRDLALWNFALKVRSVARIRRNFPDPPADTPRPAVPDEPREEYLAGLRTLRDSLAAEGTPFVMTAFPSHLSIYRDTAAERMHWLAAALEAEHIPYIDLYTPLRDARLDVSVLYLMPRDGHASPLGNRLAAERIADALVRRPELADRCTPPVAESVP